MWSRFALTWRAVPAGHRSISARSSCAAGSASILRSQSPSTTTVTLPTRWSISIRHSAYAKSRWTCTRLRCCFKRARSVTAAQQKNLFTWRSADCGNLTEPGRVRRTHVVAPLGGKGLRIDYNHVFEDVCAFLEWFKSDPDCGINGFLAFDKHGRAARLLANEDVLKTQSGEKLAEFKEAQTEIDCRKCGSIGDAVICAPSSPILVPCSYRQRLLDSMQSTGACA